LETIEDFIFEVMDVIKNISEMEYALKVINNYIMDGIAYVIHETEKIFTRKSDLV